MTRTRRACTSRTNLNHRVDLFDAFSLASLGSFGRFGYGPGVGNLAIARAVGALADVPGGGVLATDTANNRPKRSRRQQATRGSTGSAA